MNTVLSGGLYLEPGHPGALEARQRHRLKNPAHDRLKKIARQKGWKRVNLPPPWLDAAMLLPAGHPWAGGVALPRNGLLEDLGEPVDCRTSPEAQRLASRLTLRPYQQEAFWSWFMRYEGLVVAPCGSGKTAIGLAAIGATAAPALVLVHTRDLVDQWAARAEEAFGLPPKIVQDGSGPTEGRVVVATVQTLATWPFWDRYRWGKSFGLVVVDEVQHVPCDTVSTVLYSMPARWRLGLTATPKRQDGLTPILHWHLGPIVATVDQRALLEEGVVIAPRVRPVETTFRVREKEEWGDLLSRLTQDAARTELVVTQAAELAGGGRQVLVLTERREHAERIAEDLTARGLDAAAVHSHLPMRDRRDRLARAAAGSLEVLVATQLADEGLDLPAFSGLVLACPNRGHGRLRQRVGRVARACNGKRDAVVVDLVDGGWLGRLWTARARVYRELGCVVQEGGGAA